MNLNELTLGQLKEIQTLFGKTENNQHPFKIGENYLLRTVTMIYSGKLKAVYANELVITDACWIADTGRWSDSLVSCEFKEVEPYPAGDVIIQKTALIDCSVIMKLPKEQK